MKSSWQFHNPVFESEPYDPWWMSESPWSTNRRFAYDLVTYVRPKTIVELGTHYGCSLFTFAQAIKDESLKCEVWAIDTWYGDQQAGFYGEEVIEKVKLIRQEVFPSLKINLVRKTFDEAEPDFKDNSIDLIHIDGLHTYAAVKHDFEKWLPKLRTNGIMLFHDITGKAKENEYGSVRFWQRLKKQYPNIQMDHNWGLGVLFPKGDKWLKEMRRSNLPAFLKMYEDLSMSDLERVEYKNFIHKQNEQIAQLASQEAEEPEAPAPAKRRKPKASVAVIVRTKDRPVLLERAIKSIMQQTYRDLIMVIVNDGGQPKPVIDLVEKYSLLIEGRMKIIHNKTSQGMQNASNQGIEAVDSTFITIHDDDDSWHPRFLEETVSFLELNQSMGVITGTIRIVEHIENGAIFIDRREIFEQRFERVAIQDMAKVNFFPPIAFVFRRSVIEVIGYYNEEFSVLGDWDFNLRFLRHFDIDVLPETLAFYHHRLQLDTSSQYTNSIVVRQGLPNVHMYHDIRARNFYLRQELNNNQLGLGFLINLGQWQREVMKDLPAPPPPAPIVHPPLPNASIARQIAWPLRFLYTTAKRPVKKPLRGLFDRLEMRRDA